MFNYMTDMTHVEIDQEETIVLSVEGTNKCSQNKNRLFLLFNSSGHDMMSLLYNFLDEFLFKFSTDYFICKRAVITEFDREKHKIVVEGWVIYYSQVFVWLDYLLVG